MVLRKLMLMVLLPVRVAAFEKTRLSDKLLETSKDRAAVLSEIPELPSVIVRAVPSAKLNVELFEALMLLMFVDNAPAPLKKSVPPPVDWILPLFVFVPARVVVRLVPTTWLRLPAPLMLFEIVVTAVLPIWKVAPLSTLKSPLPTEPDAPEREIVPAVIEVAPL